MASLHVYVWLRFGAQIIRMGPNGPNQTVKTFDPYIPSLKFAAAVAIMSSSVTIAHYWEDIDETNVPALAAKLNPFAARTALQVYLATDATIHVTMFAFIGLQFRRQAWGIIFILFIFRVSIWALFFKDPDEGKAADTAESVRREWIRGVAYKLATGCTFAPGLLCHDVYIEEKNGLEKGQLNAYRPLIVQMFFSAAESCGMACIHCIIGIHPTVPMGCTCRASNSDTLERENCLAQGSDPNHARIGTGTAALPSEKIDNSAIIFTPFIWLGALWFLKLCALWCIWRLRKRQLTVITINQKVTADTGGMQYGASKPLALPAIGDGPGSPATRARHVAPLPEIRRNPSPTDTLPTLPDTQPGLPPVSRPASPVGKQFITEL